MSVPSAAQRALPLPEAFSPWRSLLRGARLVALLTLLAVAWAATQTGVFRGDLINAGGWALVQQFFAAALRPELRDRKSVV